jgi:tetraacyldisaccharide 4'-kinase
MIWRILLLPLGWLYFGVMLLRNYFFDRGIFKTVKLPCVVISIGNLTMGGTGKTPLVDLILEDLKVRELKTLVLSRGYRGRYTGVQRVVDSPDAAATFGDEPVFLMKRHPQVPVYVTRSRSKNARSIFERERPELIILDDGFQHRGLMRDLDIVTIDVTQSDMKPIPAGRAREGWSSLKRAQIVVLTKVNLASPERVTLLKSRVPRNITIVEAEYHLGEFRNLNTGEKKTKQQMSGLDVVAVSAIAQPSAFSDLLEKEGLRVVTSLAYRDHHNFSDLDFQRISLVAKSKNSQNIVITEKDAVKIRSTSADFAIWVAELNINLVKNRDRFHEILHKFSH